MTDRSAWAENDRLRTAASAAIARADRYDLFDGDTVVLRFGALHETRLRVHTGGRTIARHRVDAFNITRQEGRFSVAQVVNSRSAGISALPAGVSR